MRAMLVYTDGEVIGDGILRLAFAQALKKAAPDVRLTWLSTGHSVYSTTLSALAQPIIDELIILPNRKLPLRDYFLRPAVLRDRHFDLILDTQRNARRTVWLKRIRHRHFISAAADGLLSTFPVPPLAPHFLTRLLQLGSIGLNTELRAEALPLPPGDWQAQATALLPSGPRYIGFVIGAGHPDKCWPRDHFIALAVQVAQQGMVPVFFLGPGEQAYQQALQAAVPRAVFPLSANASPYLTIALSACLTAAVANDSGGGHLLAAADTPLVTLFRSRSVREKFMPCTTRVIALAPEDFGATGIDKIPHQAVVEALARLV